MRHIMKKTVLKLFSSLMLAMLLSGLVIHQASALSMGVGPSFLTIKNAVPGNTYLESIWVYNSENVDGVFDLLPSGDTASWMTFYSFDNQTQVISDIAVPANGCSYADVKFNIPADASPVVYRGEILVTTKNTNSEEVVGGAQVQMQLPIEVIIQMEGAPDVMPEPTPVAPTIDPNYKPGELNLTSLSYEGQPTVGQVFKIQAVLYNPTQTEISATLIGEVYQGDKLIDMFKSDPIQVNPLGASKTLTTYYKPTQSGDLTISGYIYYADGKTTPKQDIKFKVAEAGGTPVMAIVGAVVGAAVIGGAVPFYLKRRKQNGKHPITKEK